MRQKTSIPTNKWCMSANLLKVKTNLHICQCIEYFDLENKSELKSTGMCFYKIKHWIRIWILLISHTVIRRVTCHNIQYHWSS
jgi:hypothetical protein